MPCIECDDGVEICGPDASQSDCNTFQGFDILADKDPGKCPDGWCFERRCEENGKSYSIWRPTRGRLLRHAYTEYRPWHPSRCANC